MRGDLGIGIGVLIFVGAGISVAGGLFEEWLKNSPTDWAKREWPDQEYSRAVKRLADIRESGT